MAVVFVFCFSGQANKHFSILFSICKLYERKIAREREREREMEKKVEI